MNGPGAATNGPGPGTGKAIPMRTQRTPGHEPDDFINLKQALLGLLVIDHPGLWSTTELTRSLIPSSGNGGHATDVEDALEDLYAAGLIHRLGSYVFATRAAHAAEHVNA
jgi:hypothetical protein